MVKGNKEIYRLPLTNDYVFKRVFAKEGNEDILQDFLEAILEIPIKKVEVKNPELPKNIADEKLGILDLKVHIDDKIVVDVEIQMGNEQNIEHRSTRYMTKLSSDQLKTRDKYIELKKVIVINILNFIYYKRNSYHLVAHMKFEETRKKEYVNLGYTKEDEVVTDDLEMHFIELPKFKRKNPGVATKLEQWLWMIIGEEEKVKMAKKENKEIEKVVEELDEMSLSEKEREIYEARQRAIFEYNDAIYSSRKFGIKETQINTAKEMLLMGLSEEQIEKATKLTEEDIKNIIEEFDEKEREIYEARQRDIFEYDYAMYTAEERGKKETAKKMLLMGLSEEQAEEASKLTKEKIKKIIEEFDEKEREIYEARQRDIFEYNDAMYTAEKRGKKEKQEEIAKQLLKMGLDKEQIREATGITEEELEKIMKN